jgi:hypothetical protein
MGLFVVGMRVKKNNGESFTGTLDFTAVVKEIQEGGRRCDLEVIHGTWTTDFLQNVHPNPPRKHAAVIRAWAEGADIQHKAGERWGLVINPGFFASAEYRVKPEPTPVQLERIKLEAQIKNLQEQIDSLPKE